MEMKFRIMYRFKVGESYGEWHFYSEEDNLRDAKIEVNKLKKHLGKFGTVKIVKVN